MIKDAKVAISGWFNTNWTDTVIHYYGLNFDVNGKEEWLMVAYEPVSMTQNGIDFDSYKQKGKIIISFYARKENRTFELMDILLGKIKGINVAGMIHNGILNPMKGDMQTVNGDYKSLTAVVYLKDF